MKKTDFDDKLKNLKKKITSNKSKHLQVENELKKLQTFDSSLFIGQSYFFNYGAQLSLIFQALYYKLLPLLIIVFIQWLNDMKIQNFV